MSDISKQLDELTHERAIGAAIMAYHDTTNDPEGERDMGKAIAAYLAASGQVLVDADPVAWAHHNAVSNGYGFLCEKETGMVWDFAAQNWGNADVPLYAYRQPFPHPHPADEGSETETKS